VGNSVQPANHGAIRVQSAASIGIERAHQSHGHCFFIRFYSFPADQCCPRLYILLFLKIQFIQSRMNIQIFQIGMMIKTGPAAVVLTSLTVKSVVFGRLGILSIHDGKNALQPIKESGQNGIVKINWKIRQA
jgi:hypothetical protein